MRGDIKMNKLAVIQYLEERAADFFKAKQFSPFMLLAAEVKEDKKEIE